MRRFLLISLTLLVFATPQARAEVVLIVRKQAEASGNYVRVCDIARVEGPRDQARAVANTVLGPTPPKGQAREITRWDIENRLFEMGVNAKISFSGNDMVKVYGNGSRMRFADGGADVALQPLGAVNTRGRAIGLNLAETAAPQAKPPVPLAPNKPERPMSADPSFLDGLSPASRDLLGKTVGQYLSGRYSRPDIEVEATVCSLSQAVPDGAYEISVLEAVDGRVPGRATLRLGVKETAESEPVIVTVAADTKVYGLALVAKRQLFKGEVLESKDVRVARTVMEGGKTYLPPNPKAAAGRELSRGMAQGEAILASEAVPTEAVKRGDIVKVITGGSGWEIRSNGKALGNGKVGDTIKVEDVGTRSKYSARITDRGTVTVLPKDWRTAD